MNARYQIIVAAMSLAYSHARQLGYAAQRAADEAMMVAQFIREAVE
jgi:hypothetical protein